MRKLILVRHGETNKNIGNSLHAANDPEILNETGVKQIRQTAEKLKNYSPSIIYSSNEKRALESAELISAELSIPVEPIKGMQERNWGIYSGKPWSEVQKILNPMSLEERFTYIPPGGESWEQFEKRLIEAITVISGVSTHRTSIVVTHGGAIRALMPFLLKVPREESFNYDPDNASISVFNYNNNAFSEIVVNDISHLKS